MDYVRRQGWVEEDIAHLRYRGDGCPGPMVMRTHGGEEFAVSYNEMWEDEARWQLMFRCKICPDSVGDLADITVGRRLARRPAGHPRAWASTASSPAPRAAQALVEEMIRGNAITITEPLGYDGLELAQGSHMYKKQSLTSRFAAMRDAGLIEPDFRDLRLEDAAAMLTPEERQANYDGTKDRLERGDNIEAMPVAP